MEIQKDFRNELLKRQEISLISSNEKNPGFLEMKKKISEGLSKPEDCIDVYNVKGKFGRDTFLIKAYVYDSPKILMQMKEMSKTKKQRGVEKKAKEDAVKAAMDAKKGAEKPAEKQTKEKSA